MAVKGNHRGVEHPVATDSALIGDTRHKLHYAPLPKQEHPYKAHQNPMPNGEDGNMLRYDSGGGTGEGGEF
jgi:hypothetical protein